MTPVRRLRRSTCSTGTCSSWTARAEPDPGHRARTGGVTDRHGLQLARGRSPPLTANPGYKSDFVDGYKHPQQLYARFEEIAAAVPGHRRDRHLPNKTNGYQRKAQATIGGTGQAAVVVGSAAWGHEGGNDITVEFVDRPGADLPLGVEVTGKAVRVLLAKDAAGRARPAPPRRSRPRWRPGPRA